MAEINIKSPVLQERELGTHKFTAKVTWNGPCCCCVSTIDIPGLTVASVAAVDSFTLAGFECAADVAIDTSRPVGVSVLNWGTIAGVSAAEVGAMYVEAASAAGTAGSRLITVQFGGAFTSATDSLTNAIIEFTIPIKNKDF